MESQNENEQTDDTDYDSITQFFYNPGQNDQKINKNP